MARGGFLRRIGRTIKNIIAPPERHAPPPPPPKPEPPKEQPSEYRRIWRHAKGKGSYEKNLKVFHNLIDPVESDPDEKLALWESYVENIVSPSRRKARRQDTANLFWRDSGIDPVDFNWKAWREAMGFTGTRRSRTP